jgi:putative cardiolipin synthase
MVWQETDASGKPVIWQQEPGASWLKQVMLAIVGVLPVEWML